MTNIKNLHMTHLDELILDIQVPHEYTLVTEFLSNVVDLLSSHTSSKTSITTKWDGAPAIFCGTDPEDGQFFVGTKAIFNATPKLIKKQSDLDLFGIKGGLREKLSIALEEMPKLKIPRGTVLQGDILFTSGDIEFKKIDGDNYITFQPNTILYAVPSSSELARKMIGSKIGLIFHTTYTGSTISEMSASFGADVSKLKRVPTVWFDDAEYKDYSNVLFSAKESATTKLGISKIEKLEKIITGKLSAKYNDYHLLQRNLKSAEIGAGLKTFFNSQIRNGKLVKNGRSGYLAYIDHVEKHFNDKVIAKVKSEKGKMEKEVRKTYVLKYIRGMKELIEKIIDFTLEVMKIKDSIIRKLESGINKEIKNFVVDDRGIRVTNPEGFVAIDKLTGGAVKFVDRLEFSNLNFNVQKKWTK